MAYNYSKLMGKIVEVFKYQKDFAKAMGKSEKTITLKLLGRIPWTQAEMKKACELLGIPLKEIHLYFFAI